MTAPARILPLPTPGQTQRREKAFLMCDKAEEAYLLRNGTADTRVFTLLVSRKKLTQYRLRTVSLADVMEACDLGPSAAKKALANHIKAGCCQREPDGRYAYVKVTGPRLASSPTPEKRGRWDRLAKAQQREEAAQSHNPGHERGQDSGHNYGRFEPKNTDWDGFKASPKELRSNIYINPTTTCSNPGAPVQEGTAPAGALASAAEVVVVGETQTTEPHPPVGGAASAAGQDNLAHSQDFLSQGEESQEKPATNNENVPPAAATLAARTRPELAGSARHPVPATLNRILADDWRAAFGVIEEAGLSGMWDRWDVCLSERVGQPLSASQQLGEAEQWAGWIGRGLAESLRLQVPDSIRVGRDPQRHLDGAMTRRAQEAKRAPTGAQTGGGEPVTCSVGQRWRDPRGRGFTVEAVYNGLAYFEEEGAPVVKLSALAAWEVIS